MKLREKELEKEKNREEKERERERLEFEKLREKEEKEIEKEKNREKERERQEREYEKKKEKDNERREEHLRLKEELDKEKEEKEKMKFRNKEEKQRQKEREREERERQKQKEKEEREKEKQRLREERKRYNERFQNASKLLRLNNGYQRSTTQPKYGGDSGRSRQQGAYYQRLAYNSSRLYHRKRRHSHKRIQPKNRIPRIEPAKKLGKTTLKIIKPKRYDEDETESEPGDFEDKLMKFPRFRAKYGKNYVLKNKNKFVNLNTYISDSLNKHFGDYQRPREIENKMGNTKKTNLTISEVDEEKNNNANKTLRRGRLSQVKPKGRLNTNANLNRKMREILGKQYKILVDDPLNPYGTFWPSNFLKAGYDTGFEYEDFQSGVPLLKLRNLGKKQLPPIKKKGLNFNNNTIYTPNKNTTGRHLYPGTSAKKKLHEELWENRPNKSEYNKNSTAKLNTEENSNLKGITEENEIIYDNL